MPMLDPARAGLTNTGHDSACTASMAAALSRSHSLSVITVYGPTGSPADARSTFITCLSIITADAVTPDPTYLTSARSSSPWMVPSSPNGPCSSGKTTSTSPRVRGGRPASCTTRVRSVALVGTMTLAASVSTSGTWPGARRRACGSSGASTQWPSLAMPTGTTS